MAAEDPADLVTLKLTFWHGTKKPGDTVQVRRDDLPSWRGFAVPVDDEPEPKTDTPAATDSSTAKAAAKTSTAKA